MRVSERAPAKVNLVLHVGAPRPDGLHPVASLFASLDLADSLDVETRDPVGDEGTRGDVVVCPGVEGENLAARAASAFREATVGPGLPPLAVTIHKRIPVAAGLGGGSADAAAVLRAANALAGAPLDADALRRLGARVGSDVPSQVEPGGAVVSGAGEVVEPVRLAPLTLALVPQERGLSTAAVYAELDRLRAAGEAPLRDDPDPGPLRRLARGGSGDLARALENDLEAAAVSLRPELGAVLGDLRIGGALGAAVSGSGPTVFGVFPDRARAEDAAREHGGIVAETA